MYTIIMIMIINNNNIIIALYVSWGGPRAGWASLRDGAEALPEASHLPQGASDQLRRSSL